MSKYVIDDSTLASIAEAIRGKTGGTDPIAVTDMAAQIASITGGGSSDEVILEERDVLLALENGMYLDMMSAPNPIKVGETYRVVWGDSEGKKEYECTALSIAGTSFGTYGSVAMGNTVLLNGTDNGVPFVIVYNATTARFLIVAIYATEADTYTIAIHKKSSGGGSIEGVVYVTFKNWDGTDLVTKPVFIGNSCMDVVANGTIETPTRESTNTQTFEYSGWSLTAGGAADASALLNVDTDRTVYAAYTASTRYYTVRFFDGDTLLHTDDKVVYGSMPNYEPEKEGFGFGGWQPALVPVVADADYYAQWEEKLTFANASWSQIAEISEAGQAEQYFSLGDTKTIPLNGDTITVCIVGFNHDNLADGSGKAGISIMCSTLPNYTTKLNGHYGDQYGYRRKVLANTILPALPSGLQAVIKPVLKKARYITNGDPKDYTDYLWNPSLDELGNPTNATIDALGEPYAYVPKTNGMVAPKYIGTTNELGKWWTRTTYCSGTSTRVFYADNSGKEAFNYVTSLYSSDNVFYIPFGFCI